MGWVYAFFKCADKSFKGFSQLEKLKALEDKFSLDDFLAKEDLPSEIPASLPDSEDEQERISRYNQVKEQLLQQILPFCICSEYFQAGANNHLTTEYLTHALQAADLALTSTQESLEQVLEQNHTDYDTAKATALVVRYAIAKGFLKLKSPADSLVKNIFMICPVRNLTDKENEYLQGYIAEQEAKGHKVHYPPRDTDQDDPIGLNICLQNREAIQDADEVHIYWNPASSGSNFDFGMTFMVYKPIKFINKDHVPKTPHKSFQNVLHALDELYALD